MLGRVSGKFFFSFSQFLRLTGAWRLDRGRVLSGAAGRMSITIQVGDFRLHFLQAEAFEADLAGQFGLRLDLVAWCGLERLAPGRKRFGVVWCYGHPYLRATYSLVADVADRRLAISPATSGSGP